MALHLASLWLGATRNSLLIDTPSQINASLSLLSLHQTPLSNNAPCLMDPPLFTNTPEYKEITKMSKIIQSSQFFSLLN